MVSFLKRIDFLLLLPAVLLSSLGLLMIYSVSFESDPSFFVRQLFYVAFSVIIYLVISRFDFKTISHLSLFLYMAVVLLIVLTSFVGVEVRGSTRWINLGFVTIQGSELAKPVFVLAMAYFLSRRSPSNFKNFFISAGFVLIPILLILRQPDLSNSLILFSTWVFMIFIAGVNLFHLAFAAFGVLISLPLAWDFILKDYQRARILTFFNPNLDPQGASYNVVQALIALGSGQMVGRGLGRGTQSHLDFLPEGRTDFIFAAAGEELGFIGISLIILIFAFLVYRILRIGSQVKDAEKSLFAFGAAFILLTQFFINAGMNMGIFPVSGVTLPLVSFGGSSILSLFILIALVQLSAKKT